MKKRKIRALTPSSRSFKVIEVGIKRKPVCDFLLVINSNCHNWHPISCRFGVIVAYCSNFGHCVLKPLFGGLETVRCSSWAHWKARSWLPISFNWIFSLDVTAEALRSKIDRKAAISLQRGQFDSKFQIEGVATSIIFARIVGPMNALQLCRWQFSHKKLCNRLSSREVRIDRKRPFCVFFEPPLGT